MCSPPGRDSSRTVSNATEKTAPPRPTHRSMARSDRCAGEDLNLHGLLRPLGPQPSASTNSATSALRDAQCSGWFRRIAAGTGFARPCSLRLADSRNGAKSSCERSERTLRRRLKCRRCAISAQLLSTPRPARARNTPTRASSSSATSSSRRRTDASSGSPTPRARASACASSSAAPGASRATAA